MRGIVLAGGKSTRFGSDKALAEVDGLSMLGRAIEILSKLRLETCIVTNASSDYSRFKSKILRDAVPEKGPLGGLYTALSYLERSTVIVLTCDMPVLTLDQLRSLLSAYSDGDEAVVFARGKVDFEPFPGIYCSSLKELIYESICGGELSMQKFIRKVRRKKVIQSEVQLDNVNTQEELKKLINPQFYRTMRVRADKP